MHRFKPLGSVLARGWHWLWSRDPFSVTARWGVGHRQIAAWIATGALVALVVYPVTRWEVIVTLWGILGAGLLVALILEEHAEPIQRRAWLRRNVRTVQSVVAQLGNNVGLALSFGIGLTNDISTPLRFASTFRERQESARLAREAIRAFTGGGLPANERAYNEYSVWLQYLRIVQNLAVVTVTANQPLMNRIVEVHAAVNELEMFSNFAGATFPVGTPPQEVEGHQRMMRGQIAERCLTMCELCNAVLNEAGALED